MVSATNPYQALRRKYKITPKQLNISPQTVLKIERGHYEALSDRMVGQLALAVTERGAEPHEIADLLETRYGTPYLDRAYVQWRKAQRRRQATLRPLPDTSQLHHETQSPIMRFIELYTKTSTAFCHALCLQESTVMRYARGEFNYEEPPKALITALTDARYPEITELVGLQRRWIDGKRA